MAFIAICGLLYFDYDTVISGNNYIKQMNDDLLIHSNKAIQLRKKAHLMDLENYEKLNNTIYGADFYNITDNSEYYNINADSVRKNGNFIELDNIKSMLQISSHERLMLTAHSGNMNIINKTLYANGGISFGASLDSTRCKRFYKKCSHHSNNTKMVQYNVYADEIHVDYPKYLINVRGGVKMKSYGINISSTNMKMNIKKKLAAFNGKVRIDIMMDENVPLT